MGDGFPPLVEEGTLLQKPRLPIFRTALCSSIAGSLDNRFLPPLADAPGERLMAFG